MSKKSYNNQERSMILSSLLAGEYLGEMSDKDCPYCHSQLVTNQEIVWCSNVGCTYSNDQGMKQFLRSLYKPSDYIQLELPRR
jgi:hypothetical protein